MKSVPGEINSMSFQPISESTVDADETGRVDGTAEPTDVSFRTPLRTPVLGETSKRIVLMESQTSLVEIVHYKKEIVPSTVHK